MDYFELWANGPKFINNGKAYPVSTDSVVLAHFADLNGARTLLDIGCGGGLLGISKAWTNERLAVTGIEIDGEVAEEARRNVRLSGLEGRVDIICGDACAYAPSTQFDAAISNPPYFRADGGTVSKNASRATARTENGLTVESLAAAASRCVRYGGKFFFVYRTDGLSRAICAMEAKHLAVKRLRFVHDRVDRAAALVMVECRVGGGTGLITEKPLIMKNSDGTDTDEVKAIYRMA